MNVLAIDPCLEGAATGEWKRAQTNERRRSVARPRHRDLAADLFARKRDLNRAAAALLGLYGRKNGGGQP
jgi:hypothetical protein